jgi:DNA polymerase-3 subunit delta'
MYSGTLLTTNQRSYLSDAHAPARLLTFAGVQFKDVAGLVPLKSQLIHGHAHNRVPHAQLFLEPPGGGGLALALAFAQYLFCEEPQSGDSCGVCPACRKVGALTHPDLHLSFPTVSFKKEPSVSDDFVRLWRQCVTANPYLGVYEWLTTATAEVSEGKTKQGNITVAECKQIIRKLSYKTFEAPIKVLVLWMAEYLDQAGNTLLKTLEEPPEGTYIILVAQDMNQILPTILSRTQLVRLIPLQDEEVSEYLRSHSGLDDKRAMDIARMADGNLTVALSMTTDTSNRHTELFKVWMRGCFKRDPKIQVPWVEEFAGLSREDQKAFMAYALHYFRESLVMPHHTFSTRLFDEELDGAKYLANKLDADQFALVAAHLNEGAYHIERNGNARIVMLDLTLLISEILHGEYDPRAARGLEVA